jgi:DNA-binding response OmpR family regulator
MPIKDNILIVDDEPKLARSLSLILQQAGYGVTTACDAAQALQLLQAGAYDLVYLDIRLPDRNGMQLLPQMRAQYPDMPVVILTAHGSLETAIGAVRVGASDYLLKPIDPKVILETTEKILQEQQKPKKRRAITSQIQSLLSELHAVDGAGEGASTKEVETSTPDPARYLKRAGLLIDLHTHHISLNDQAISLPPSTFDYLVTLMRHSPDPVPYEVLVKESQGYQQVTRLEAKEMTRWQIHELRKAFGDTTHPRMIITVRDVGYRLVI